VEAVGAEVERFVPGDEVFASTEMLLGGYAEYCCLPENIAIAKKPQNMSYEEAAAVPTGALTAWYFLQKTKIRAHQNQGQLKVLIYGASGSVGTFALQLSSLWGAGVTGVCSGANLELVKSLGANRVLDYTKTNISQVEDRYDIIFDCVGKLTKAAARPLLRNNGEYVSVESGEVSQFTYHNLEEIQALIEEGRLKSVIDRSYDLEDIRQAHSYVERGHKIGNVAIGIS
jgi:NADPH:quinone reductase-like Zn-dependent oxidoreductase